MLNQSCQITSECTEETQGSFNIVKQCYQEPLWSKDSFFCECSSWFGFTGKACNLPTPFLWYRRVAEPVLLSWAVVLVLMFLVSIIRFLRRLFKNNKRKVAWQKLKDVAAFPAAYGFIPVFSNPVSISGLFL